MSCPAHVPGGGDITHMDVGRDGDPVMANGLVSEVGLARAVMRLLVRARAFSGKVDTGFP